MAYNEVAKEYYFTLQEAVDDAAENDVITLLKDGETAIVGKTITILREHEGTKYEATVSALKDYTVIEDEGQTRYEVKEAKALEDETDEPAFAYIDLEVDGYTGEEILPLQTVLDTAALTANASNEVRVRLYPDYDEDYVAGTVIIPSYVVLDIEGYELIADRVIGLNNSKITGALDSSSKDGVFTGGLLKVPVGNLVLSEEPYNDGTFDILPIWDPDENVLAYRFSRFNANTSGNAQGLYIKAEENKIEFKWNHQATGEVNKQLLSDSFGADDNELSIIVRIQWENDTGVVKQDYVYNAGFVQTLASNKDNKNWDYALTIAGYKSLGINMEKLRVIPMIVTNSGATSAGKQWTEENSK